MLKALSLGALILALGAALGWKLASPRSENAAPRSAAPDRSVKDEMRELRQLIETLRGDLALRSAQPFATDQPAAPLTRDAELQASRSSREREPVESGPSLSDLGKQIASLEAAVTELRNSVANKAMPARFPSYELIQRSPPVADWSRLQPFVDDSLSRNAPVSDALLQTVKWRSQEEILTAFGRPTRIYEDGRWVYHSPSDAPKRTAVYVTFVEDYVTDIKVGYW